MNWVAPEASGVPPNTGEVRVFAVSVWVLPRLTRVSVAAGMVTVNADAAEAVIRLTLPVAVEDASFRMPAVAPATPIVSVGDV